MIRPDTQIAREELELLFGEIETYLGIVDAFRREGHEPRWRREPVGHSHA